MAEENERYIEMGGDCIRDGVYEQRDAGDRRFR
jgi:hypothetical protein